MNDKQRADFEEYLDLDLAYGTPDGSRHRVTLFQQRGSIGMVLRLIPPPVPPFDRLNLPRSVLHPDPAAEVMANTERVREMPGNDRRPELLSALVKARPVPYEERPSSAQPFRLRPLLPWCAQHGVQLTRCQPYQSQPGSNES